MDFECNVCIQSYPDTTNLSPLEMNITPTVGGDNVVVEPEDDDDPNAGDNRT